MTYLAKMQEIPAQMWMKEWIIPIIVRKRHRRKQANSLEAAISHWTDWQKTGKACAILEKQTQSHRIHPRYLPSLDCSSRNHDFSCVQSKQIQPFKQKHSEHSHRKRARSDACATRHSWACRNSGKKRQSCGCFPVFTSAIAAHSEKTSK